MENMFVAGTMSRIMGVMQIGVGLFPSILMANPEATLVILLVIVARLSLRTTSIIY
jgi:hypothetical protein